jgi:hypothetical protein
MTSAARYKAVVRRFYDQIDAATWTSPASWWRRSARSTIRHHFPLCRLIARA